jgi:zinc protease
MKKLFASVLLKTGLVFLATLPLVQHSTVQAQAVAIAAQKIQSVEGITEYRLSNGLKILLAPDVADERVTVNVTYFVGSRHEGYGETGMAHLLEHLIFKGTPNTKDPKAEFQRRGFNFNGTTNQDRTNYYATFVSNQESLNWYIGWQADAMINSFIAKADLDSEMTVVRNEYEQSESNPVQALIARMAGTAYLWHNYGKSTIGAKSDIENVDIRNLQAFYKRFYRPDNAIITIAGKFDVATTLTSIERAFGPLIKPSEAMPATYTVDPVQDGERMVVVRRPAPIQVLLSGYHVPPILHPDATPLSLLSLILADAPSGRLHKALVETKMAQGVFGGTQSRTEAGTQLFGAVFGPSDDADARRKILFEIVESIAANPITAEEFERAKIKLNKSMELGFTNMAAVASGATEMAVHGDWRAVFVGRERAKAVSLDDVNRVAKQYLLRDNRTLGHLVPTEKPTRAPEPGLAKVADYMKGFAFKSEAEVVAAFDFSLPNMEKNTIVATTAGGIKTAVLNKAVRGELVTASLQLRFGDLNSLKGQQWAGQAAGALLVHGTSKMTRQQISDELTKLGAQVRFGLSTTGGTVSITSKKTEFGKVFALVTHLLKDSVIPDKEFDELQAAWVSSIEGQAKDKSARAANEWSVYGNPYAADDVRYTAKLDESIQLAKSLTATQVRAFHREFYGAQNAMFSIVGPVDAKQIQDLVASELDSWKSKQAYVRVPNPLVNRTPASLKYETPDKANASIQSYVGVALKTFDSEAFALQLATRIFGGGPASRLWERLREKEGLTYGASASFSSSFLEANGRITLGVDVNPANIGKTMAVLEQELTSSLTNGFNQQELDKAKAQIQADRARGRSGDPWALGQLNWQLEHGTPWNLALTNDAKYAAVTLEELNSAWRKYVDPKKFVTGVFADPAKVQ